MRYPRKNDILTPSYTKFDEVGYDIYIVREVNERADTFTAESVNTGVITIVEIDGVLLIDNREFENLNDRLPKAQWYKTIHDEFLSFLKMLTYSAVLILVGVGLLITERTFGKIDVNNTAIGFISVGLFILIASIILNKDFHQKFNVKEK